jgi:hypothetical protein
MITRPNKVTSLDAAVPLRFDLVVYWRGASEFIR